MNDSDAASDAAAEQREGRRIQYRLYAELEHPERCSGLKCEYWSHTDRTLTLQKCMPMAMYHFEIIPRLSRKSPMPKRGLLRDLRTLLQNKYVARQVLGWLAEDAEACKRIIEEDMLREHGFKWRIYMGFHPDAWHEHIRMHVFSEDLVSPHFDKKEQYNKFVPRLKYFLCLDEILSWFDGVMYRQYAALLNYSTYLNETARCWKCDCAFEDIGALKRHLDDEWKKAKDKARAKRDVGAAHAKQRKLACMKD